MDGVEWSEYSFRENVTSTPFLGLGLHDHQIVELMVKIVDNFRK